MLFSVNQNRQLYVAKAYKNNVADLQNPGDITFVSNKSGEGYFVYVGPNKNVIKSPYIQNVMWCKKGEHTDMHPKTVTVTLNPNINNGAPVASQDYVLRIMFRQFVGMSDTDTYIKFGTVHATASMTAVDFYNTLAVSLFKNFSRELTPLVEFSVGGSKIAKIKKDSSKPCGYDLLDADGTSITANNTGITITEVKQDWTLGVKEFTRVYFDVFAPQITFDGDDVDWLVAVAGEDTTETWTNGMAMADLEYFCAGERGDQYRQVGWPNYIPTYYVIGAEGADKAYDTVEVHFAYVGANENVHKSEKDVTIVFDATSASVYNGIKGALSAADITVDE